MYIDRFATLQVRDEAKRSVWRSAHTVTAHPFLGTPIRFYIENLVSNCINVPETLKYTVLALQGLIENLRSDCRVCKVDKIAWMITAGNTNWQHRQQLQRKQEIAKGIRLRHHRQTASKSSRTTKSASLSSLSWHNVKRWMAHHSYLC